MKKLIVLLAFLVSCGVAFADNRPFNNEDPSHIWMWTVLEAAGAVYTPCEEVGILDETILKQQEHYVCSTGDEGDFVSDVNRIAEITYSMGAWTDTSGWENGVIGFEFPDGYFGVFKTDGTSIVSFGSWSK